MKMEKFYQTIPISPTPPFGGGGMKSAISQSELGEVDLEIELAV
jgi:hypothetical protein